MPQVKVLIADVTSVELVEAIIKHSRNAGYSVTRLPRGSVLDADMPEVAEAAVLAPKVALAIYRSNVDKVSAAKHELLRRLGVEQSPELTNRKAFIWIAMVLKRAVCFQCGSKPMRGRGLAHWSRDSLRPEPLLYMMAWNGATTEKIQAARDLCDVLCAKCAKARGGKLLTNRKPNLMHYGVEGMI